MSKMVVEMLRADIEEAKYKVNMAFDRMMDESNGVYAEQMKLSEMNEIAHRLEIGVKVYKQARIELDNAIKKLADYETEQARDALIAMARGGKSHADM